MAVLVTFETLLRHSEEVEAILLFYLAATLRLAFSYFFGSLLAFQGFTLTKFL